MSDYKIISALNEEHKVYLVQSALSGNIYVQKILDVYNIRVYEYLYRNPGLVGSEMCIRDRAYRNRRIYKRNLPAGKNRQL